MLLGGWNKTLMAWFFSRRPQERVYLRVDDAELERINDERVLGLDDPAQDLIAPSKMRCKACHPYGGSAGKAMSGGRGRTRTRCLRGLD